MYAPEELTHSYSPSTAMTSQECWKPHLTTLDEDLRHRIWRHAVASSKVIHLSTRHEKSLGTGTLAADWHTLRPGLPALMLTCHKLAEEVKKVYFSENVFCFTDSMLHAAPLAAFRRMLSPKLAEGMHKAKVMRRIHTDTKTFWLRFDIQAHPNGPGLLLTGGIDGMYSVSEAYVDKYPSQRRELCHCAVLELARKMTGILDFLEKYAAVVGRGLMDEVNRMVVCKTCKTVKSKHVGVYGKDEDQPKIDNAVAAATEKKQRKRKDSALNSDLPVREKSAVAEETSPKRKKGSVSDVDQPVRGRFAEAAKAKCKKRKDSAFDAAFI